MPPLHLNPSDHAERGPGHQAPEHDQAHGIRRTSRRRTLRQRAGTAATAVVALVLLAGPAAAAPPRQVFDTATSPLDIGANQGWWSATVANDTSNTNYYVGRDRRDTFADFFTFDLRGVHGRIVSATLLLTRPSPADELPATYQLHDVSTAPGVLNHNTGKSAAIVEDLSTGTIYGTYRIGVKAPRQLLLHLNPAAVAALNAARGGFFSVGGSVTGSGIVFKGSVDGAPAPQRLRMTVD